jgi:predicted nucleic acid-binding protein
LHIEAADYELAARLCLSEDAPLRAGDAVHLALCKRHNSCLVSLDKGLCRAARHHLVNVQEL